MTVIIVTLPAWETAGPESLVEPPDPVAAHEVKTVVWTVVLPVIVVVITGPTVLLLELVAVSDTKVEEAGI